MKVLVFIGLLIGLLSCSKEQIVNQDVSTLQDSTDSVPNVIISEAKYQESYARFVIDTAYLQDDILSIKLSSSGCSGKSWKVQLIDQGVVMESFPEQRNIKVLLKNEELCKAYISKEYKFNVAKTRVGKSGKILLNMKGYKREIFYAY